MTSMVVLKTIPNDLIIDPQRVRLASVDGKVAYDMEETDFLLHVDGDREMQHLMEEYVLHSVGAVLHAIQPLGEFENVTEQYAVHGACWQVYRLGSFSLVYVPPWAMSESDMQKFVQIGKVSVQVHCVSALVHLSFL